MRFRAGLLSLAAFYAAMLLPARIGKPPAAVKHEVLIPGKSRAVNDTIAILVHSATETRQDVEWKKDYDPIDHNIAWRSMVRAYNALREQGVPAKNIFVLYGNAQANHSEDTGDLADLMKQFYDEKRDLHTASRKEFRRIVSALQKEVDGNDNLIIYFDGHGSKDGSFWFESGVKSGSGSSMNDKDLASLLEGFKAKRSLIITGQCYGGMWTNGTPAYRDGTAVVAGSPKDKLNWADRDYGVGWYLLAAFNDMKNDTDKDGVVEFDEAFRATRDKSVAYDKYIKPIILDPKRYKLPEGEDWDREKGVANMRLEANKQVNGFPDEFYPGQGYRKRQ